MLIEISNNSGNLTKMVKINRKLDVLKNIFSQLKLTGNLASVLCSVKSRLQSWFYREKKAKFLVSIILTILHVV